MFSIIKTTYANARVLNELKSYGTITGSEHEVMLSVSGNKQNQAYATQLIKSRVASGKYAAAAAVFARLASFSLEGTSTGVDLRCWLEAATHAMVLEGADPETAKAVVVELVGMNTDINSQPLF